MSVGWGVESLSLREGFVDNLWGETCCMTKESDGEVEVGEEG
jgi:hypothetical protein